MTDQARHEDARATECLGALTHIVCGLAFCIAQQESIDPKKLLADWQAIFSSVDSMTMFQATMIGNVAGMIEHGAARRALQNQRVA